jgi:hypothetical protein
MWPPGPYALPMVDNGCPEDKNRDWRMYRIRITTKYPMTEQASFSGCSDKKNKSQYASFENDMHRYISGYFDTYELQVNLCFMATKFSSSIGMQWPAGNYSIYGVNHECPSGKMVYIITVLLCIFYCVSSSLIQLQSVMFKPDHTTWFMMSCWI